MEALTAADIQDLVAKAFVLEAISDKQDCTGRHQDLPGKPLESFVIAGINSSAVFYDFATSRLNGSPSVFSHHVAALQASNRHKPEKIVNFGLVEMMFQTVAARLACDDPKQVIKSINKVLRAAPKEDVTEMMRARQFAWSTSENEHKKNFEMHVVETRANQLRSPADFLDALQDYEISVSSKQWHDQYRQDWPILQDMFTGIQKSKESLLLDKITSVFNPIRERNQDIRIGIVADMCAAAIFLHLSFSQE